METISAQVYVNPFTLTADENYRINGVLTTDQIEELLKAGDLVENLSDIACNIIEALTQYPEKDFLQQCIDDIKEVSDRLCKGDNKDDLERVIQDLYDLQSQITHSSELGKEELEAVLNLVS